MPGGGIDLPGTRATVTADLTDDDSARRAVADTVDRLGGLDAVIGAAGVVDTIHRAETFPLKEFRGDIEANLIFRRIPARMLEGTSKSMSRVTTPTFDLDPNIISA